MSNWRVDTDNLAANYSNINSLLSPTVKFLCQFAVYFHTIKTYCRLKNAHFCEVHTLAKLLTKKIKKMCPATI